MTLWFTRVTPDELDRAVADPEWAREHLRDEGRELSARPFDVLAGHYDPAAMGAEEVYPYRGFWDDRRGWCRDPRPQLLPAVKPVAGRLTGCTATSPFNPSKSAGLVV